MKRTLQHNRFFVSVLTSLMLTLFTFIGCKKDEEANPNSGKTILKYELVSSMPLKVYPISNFSLQATYTNSTGQVQVEKSSSTDTVWTKTVELTSTQRPDTIVFGCSGYTNGTSGAVTINIYDNDVLKATQVGSISRMGDGNTGTISFSGLYYIKQ